MLQEAAIAAFKEQINADAARRIADGIVRIHMTFPVDDFVAAAADGLEKLELKDRVNHVADALRAHLPAAWTDAAQWLVDGAPPALESTDGVSAGMWMWPMLSVVERHGADEPEVSLPALRELTKRFSAEFAIRPLLTKHTALALEHLHAWVDDPDPHVRRLVSEGTRPRLPWGGRLSMFQRDPEPTLALLDRLVDDVEPYVRRSVANHLGDIAKDHPARAVDVARAWLKADPERRDVVKHGLRALVKAGDPGALAVLGFHPARVELERFTASPGQVAIGEAVEIVAELRSAEADVTRIVVDYEVEFARPKGRTGRKVFKGTVVDLDPGASVRVARRHALRDVSIRTHHPGPHTFTLLVQGQRVASATVQVTRG